MRLLTNNYAKGSPHNPRIDIDTLIGLAVLSVSDPAIEKSVIAALEVVVREHEKASGNADICNMAAEALNLISQRPDGAGPALINPGTTRTIGAGL